MKYLKYSLWLAVAGTIYWALPYEPLQLPFTYTSVWRYHQILPIFTPEELVSHFPKEIPSSARNLNFHYEPGFLQGSKIFQLRMELPSLEIASLYDRFSKVKTKSYFGGGIDTPRNDEEYMPATNFYTSEPVGKYHSQIFPEDYEIMIFDKVIPASERGKEFYFNHHLGHGVAISSKRSEIVYWAEGW